MTYKMHAFFSMVGSEGFSSFPLKNSVRHTSTIIHHLPPAILSCQTVLYVCIPLNLVEQIDEGVCSHLAVALQLFCDERQCDCRRYLSSTYEYAFAAQLRVSFGGMPRHAWRVERTTSCTLPLLCELNPQGQIVFNTRSPKIVRFHSLGERGPRVVDSCPP